MTGRILVVDDVPVNRQLIENYLTAEYFEVITAGDGEEALAICQESDIELVILDVVMPKLDGFTVCRKLKGDSRTHHIPVIMVTMLDTTSDKVKGLDSGADDFLHKPVNQFALITRVKNLVRFKRLMDELRVRTKTAGNLGIQESNKTTLEMSGEDGHILLVETDQFCSNRIKSILEKKHQVEIEVDMQKALAKAEKAELVIVSLDLNGFDGLRLCSQIRSSEKIRNLPLILITNPDDEGRLLRGLDMGVNDYVTRPIDENELYARVVMQLKRMRYTEKLRHDFQQNVELSVTDALTGLYNRRYLDNYLGTVVKKSMLRRKKLSILVTDIDHFKLINDTYGHDVGDAVLRNFAAYLRQGVRGLNLICRYGGEEFIIVMPDMDITQGYSLGERLRQGIENRPLEVKDLKIPVTISAGVSGLRWEGDSVESLFKRADQALYRAKGKGRNCIVLESDSSEVEQPATTDPKTTNAN